MHKGNFVPETALASIFKTSWFCMQVILKEYAHLMKGKIGVNK